MFGLDLDDAMVISQQIPTLSLECSFGNASNLIWKDLCNWTAIGYGFTSGLHEPIIPGSGQVVSPPNGRCAACTLLCQ